jgi:citrate lyase beta subunit
MHSRRALLYMPGDDRRKIEKATTLGVDCICMDMEDGVAVTRKDRSAGGHCAGDEGTGFRRVRALHPHQQHWLGEESYDLVAALATNPDTIVVPKIESADQVKWVSDHIETYELSSNQVIGSVRLMVGVETAKGILNLRRSPKRTGVSKRSSSVRRITPPPSGEAHKGSDRSAVCAPGGCHGLCGERPAGDRHGLHRLPR